MEATDYIDADEGREFATSKACYNCGAKSSDGTWLSEFCTYEGTEVLACDECIAEERRIEAEGDRLAALPSCEERQRIIDHSETVQVLVNALKAHDQTGCADCAAVPVPVCDDCEQPAASLDYDAIFDLHLCAACVAKQARLDSIVARHNAERMVA